MAPRTVNDHWEIPPIREGYPWHPTAGPPPRQAWRVPTSLAGSIARVREAGKRSGAKNIPWQANLNDCQIRRTLDLPYHPAYSYIPRVNATLAKLRSRRRQRYNPIWPEGTKQPLTKELADHFFSLISTCDTSLLQLLRSHPELPHFNQLDNWRRCRAWFSEGWKAARQNQADFLAENCLDLAKSATPKTAHGIRVQFDIFRWLAAKFSPELYGDKPATPTPTTVNVGISISSERLNEIRAKLDHTRLYLANSNTTVQSNAASPNRSTST